MMIMMMIAAFLLLLQHWLTVRRNCLFSFELDFEVESRIQYTFLTTVLLRKQAKSRNSTKITNGKRSEKTNCIQVCRFLACFPFCFDESIIHQGSVVQIQVNDDFPMKRR